MHSTTYLVLSLTSAQLHCATLRPQQRRILSATSVRNIFPFCKYLKSYARERAKTQTAVRVVVRCCCPILTRNSNKLPNFSENLSFSSCQLRTDRQTDRHCQQSHFATLRFEGAKTEADGPKHTTENIQMARTSLRIG